MKILFIGDVVGKPARALIRQVLTDIIKENSIDFCVANAENAAGGSGITPRVADELFGAGVDVITSGDHIWRNKEVFQVINNDSRVLRPANYPLGTPGKGSGLFTASNNVSVGIINILGRVFMKPVDCPFNAVRQQLDKIRLKTKIILVDFHAEATSEKGAMGWFLDGKVSAVIGTHTHIPTADNKILPHGTAYITDVGMVGSQISILGRDIEPVLKHFTTSLPSRFTVATQQIILQSVVIDIDEQTGLARSITRLEKSV